MSFRFCKIRKLFLDEVLMNIKAKTYKIIEIISNWKFCLVNIIKKVISTLKQILKYYLLAWVFHDSFNFPDTEKKLPKKVMTKIHKQQSIKTRLLAGITKNRHRMRCFSRDQKKGAIEIYVFSISIHNSTNGFQIWLYFRLGIIIFHGLFVTTLNDII